VSVFLTLALAAALADDPPERRTVADDPQSVRRRIDHNMKALEEKLRRQELDGQAADIRRELLRDLDQLLKLTNPRPQPPPAGPPPPGNAPPPGNEPDDKPTAGGRTDQPGPAGGSRTKQAPGDQQPRPGGGSAGRDKQPGEQQPSARPQPGGTRRERRGGRHGGESSQADAESRGARPGPDQNRQPPAEGRPGPRPGEAPGQPGTNPDQAQGATMPPPPNGKPERLSDFNRDVWGHLPEALRQEVDHYYRERFMPRYRDLLQQYYTRLAEAERREREKK
jgi:hypothetical protein